MPKKPSYKKIREKLVKMRDQLRGNVDALKEEALHKNSGGGSSTMPIHMADLGSDNYEQELNLGLMQNESIRLREIEEAIERIDNGEYGICEGCDGKIKKARLNALPFVRNCIECQRASER